MHAYFDKRVETAPRKAMQEAQFKRLKALVAASYKHNPFYKRKFTEHGVKQRHRETPVPP
jgi:phenylacetate-coenzyme A ligase PaaK-like adenylate-forming protein